MADPKPGDGNAARLKRWWSSPEGGLALWSTNPHPWTTLNRLLKEKGVPKHMVDGLTTNIYRMVFPTRNPGGKD